MGIFKSKLFEYFAQLFIVMIGVFLGMLVTEWKSEQNIKRTRTALLKSMQTEIEGNEQILHQSLDNMRPFFKSLDSLNQLITIQVEQELFYDRPFDERLPNWRGVGGNVLSSAMFETAKYGNVLPGMDIGLLEELSKTYALQSQVNDIRKDFIEKFLNINSQTPYADVLRLMGRIRQELGGSQYLLIERYEESLKAISLELDKKS